MAELKVMHLVRHGEVESPPCLLGSTDVVLSELGRSKLAESLEKLASHDVAMFSSPLQRCSNVASQIAKNKSLHCDLVDELREYDFGDLDGLPFTQYSNEERDTLTNFWRDPVNGAISGAESMSKFQQRISRCLFQLWDRIKADGVVVTHGGVVRMILKEVLGLGLDAYPSLLSLDIPYASITTIERFRQDNQTSYRIKRIGWTKEFN